MIELNLSQLSRQHFEAVDAERRMLLDEIARLTAENVELQEQLDEARTLVSRLGADLHFDYENAELREQLAFAKREILDCWKNIPVDEEEA